MPFSFPLPPPVARALDMLERQGFKAYTVGGCVRDALMGMRPHDYDLCTAARPEDMRRVFSGERVIATGEKHGTLTVVLDGAPLEITTFRADGSYLDGRHPVRVDFTTAIEEDLRRRDFTVNAMAYSPVHGLKDPFGGQADMAQRLLRCVGDPDARFEEDALRLLRALRFAARLHFTVEERTACAVRAHGEEIVRVSRERVAAEMNGLLQAEDPAPVMRAFDGLIFAALPQLAPMKDCPQQSVYHVYDVWEHALHAVSAAPPVLPVRWAALLHDCGKPAVRTRDQAGQDHFPGHQEAGAALARQVLESLKMPAKLTRQVCALVAVHDFPRGRENVKWLMNRLGAEDFDLLLALRRADYLAHATCVAARVGEVDELRREKERVLRTGACYRMDMLAVNGRELMALGLRGEAVGRALSALLDDVLHDRLPNDRETLLQAVREGRADGEKM
ncbi:MAG: HD domain-containing protein [Clostridiales bacterium]|nr:HD domain-containing protein [Clostridiales bacterium]